MAKGGRAGPQNGRAENGSSGSKTAPKTDPKTHPKTDPKTAPKKKRKKKRRPQLGDRRKQCNVWTVKRPRKSLS